MPGYKVHLAGGGALFGLIFIIITQPIFKPPVLTAFEWLLFMLAGALFPDVDVKSKGQKLLYLFLIVLFSLLLAQGCHSTVACLAVISLIPMIVRHRGLFHNFWFVVFFPLSVGYLLGVCFPSYSSIIFVDSLFFIAGAISHLWLDRGIKKMFR